MTTVTFVYDHSRDPMSPEHLGDLIATATGLTTDPQVVIDATSITVTAAGVGEAKRAQIQAVIDSYVFDPVWGGGIMAVLAAKASMALSTNASALALPDPTAGNNTFLGIASPTQAQTLAQVKALTNQANAIYAQVSALTRQTDVLIRLAANLLDSTSGT